MKRNVLKKKDKHFLGVSRLSVSGSIYNGMVK